MTSQEFAQEWNEVFPSSRIHHNDLANPTEAFLTNALVTLLRSISINVSSCEFDPGSNDVETVRKNKLCLFQYVNDMYRSLHNKKWHYFEFIQPTPKKTLNLLQTLLNYVLYFNMVEEETVTDTTTMLQRQREMLDKKAHLHKEREKNKIQVQHGQKTMETLSNQLEEVSQRVVEEKKNPSLKQFEDNSQLKSRHTQKLAALKVHVSELTTQCINEEDYGEMKSSIFEIQEALSEKQEALEKLTTNHESLCVEIAGLEKKISLMESVLEMVPDGKTIAPGKLNDKKEELLRTMIIYEENKKKIQEINSQLEQCQKELGEMTVKQAQLHEGWTKKLEPLEKLEETLTGQFKEFKEQAERMKTNAEHLKQDVKSMLESAKMGLDMLKKTPIYDIGFNDENSCRNF